jgi:hypothetical protein
MAPSPNEVVEKPYSNVALVMQHRAAIAVFACSTTMTFRLYVAQKHRTTEHGDEHQ